MKNSVFISICLVAVLGITACVEQQQDNPNFDPITNTVNTNFVLNIAAADNNPETKQSGANAQIDGFLGIDNATLFTFQLDKDGEKVLTPGAASAFDLSTVLTANAISVTNSRRVLELPLPLGHNAMIFYGMSMKGNRSDEEAGLTRYIYPDNNIKHIGSYAVDRLEKGSANETNFAKTQSYILAVLNGMLRIGLGAATATRLDNIKITVEAYKNKTVHWKDYLVAIQEEGAHSPLDANAKPGALEIILGNTFKALTDISDNEARSGSGSAIGSQMRDLLFICAQSETATPSNDLERVAIQFLSVIESYISTFFENDQWKEVSEVTTGITTWGIPNAGQAPSGDINNFPESFSLPSGAAVLYTEDDVESYPTYKYAESPNAVGQDKSKITDITYPPQLCYYCNSPIRISESDNLDPEDDKSYKGYPTTTSDWSNPSKWDSRWKSGYGHITTLTRGVALAFNVQYGQALLATNVYYDSNIKNATTGEYAFKDNNANIPGHSGQQDQTITVSASKPLVLTGILIGGQPNAVNWMYLPWSTIASDLIGTKEEGKHTFSDNKMVYDSYISPRDYPAGETSAKIGAALPMAQDVYNYTVLFDNYNFRDGEGQKDVFVALEIKNMTGQDFWGRDNMVRAGATFYLPITLNAPTSWPATVPTSADVANEANMMPPYYTSGDSKGKTITSPRVFMADTRTLMSVKLGQDALKSAMVTVPDLRTAKISFGLSVDLSWKTGTPYNVNLGVTSTTTTNP